MTLSLCMIVKNEEAVLARCLDCVQTFADEIIIADTGSTDRTKEIAAQYSCRIYDFPWCDDFSKARNFALEKATSEYILWLDADDIILPDDRQRLKELKDRLTPEVDAVMLPYYMAPDAQGNPCFSYYRERIVRNDPAFRFQGAVHEAIPVQGHVIYEEIPIWHDKVKPGDPDRNLRILEKEMQLRPILPRTRYYYGRELYEHGRYAEAEQQLKRFLIVGGWAPDQVDACRLRAYCLYYLGREREALLSLLQGLAYQVPGAELCCDLGQHFMDRDLLPQAVYWFQAALQCKQEDQIGFVQRECYGFIPSVQLCICYERLGNRQLALAYHEQAGRFEPESEIYKRNCEYFGQAKGEESI